MPETPVGTNGDSRASHLSILRRLGQLAKAFFIDGNRCDTRMLIAALVSLIILVGVVQVLVSYAGRNFYSSFTDRDVKGFWRNLTIWVSSFAIAIPIGVFYRYAAERLSLALAPMDDAPNS